ncbi:AAA family ATPase [Microbacterium sp. LMI1x-1-1.1]|uniref:AAA family ATPase n=1 Tax=Microbacterium sp. LMI1x-1-1.1 TaxID=3135246 RepID=UPI0034202262
MTAAEENLLGALIIEPKATLRTIEGLVSADDFTDARHGAVFSGLIAAVAKNMPIDVVAVDSHFHEWGASSLNPADVWLWTDAQRMVPHRAFQYAQVVRAESVRRQLRDVISQTAERVKNGEPALDVASSAVSALTSLVDGASSGTLQTKTLGEVLSGVDTYDWVIPGLLERQDRLVVTGGEGAGKTMWMRQLAILSASGIHPVTFGRIEPVEVLVVDAENTERQWRRATRWIAQNAAREGARDPADVVHLTAGKRIDITKGSHLAEIHRLIDHHKPDVLFIGPLYKLVSKAINSDDDAAPLIVALDSLRERNVALVMEAHAGHSIGSSGYRDLRPRGSSALLGWPEFGLGLRQVPDMDGVVDVVRWRGDRDQRDWPNQMYRGQDWPWEAWQQ